MTQEEKAARKKEQQKKYYEKTKGGKLKQKLNPSGPGQLVAVDNSAHSGADGGERNNDQIALYHGSHTKQFESGTESSFDV